MSYDRIYLCPGLNRETWAEQRKMKADGRSAEFEIAYERLERKGDYVVLVAGRNFMFDEIYFFEAKKEARKFFDSEYTARESIINGKPQGFQEISLYEDGKLVATKDHPANDLVVDEVNDDPTAE